MICDRIELIKAGKIPYFVKELETGYVVIGDHQYFEGYTLFLSQGTCRCKFTSSTSNCQNSVLLEEMSLV